MLIFNNVPPEDIIYTSCDDEISRIPEGKNGEFGIYDYLQKFFVDTYSNHKIFVIFVTSKEMCTKWGAVLEVGAAWITKSEHKIFNIGNDDYKPESPLDINSEWFQCYRKNRTIVISKKIDYDRFCSKIEYICRTIGYKHQNRPENIKHLKSLL